MSKISVKKIKCPKCGKELKVKVYESINVSLHPELKDKLLSGELTDIHCSCGYTLLLRYPILYHKMGFTDIMIYYTSLDIEEVKRQNEELKKLLMKPINGSLNSQIIKTEEIFEVYADWDDFIKRIKEIG